MGPPPPLMPPFPQKLHKIAAVQGRLRRCKPDYFERIIKRNINDRGNQGAIFVHDIEFQFEEDVEKAWADPATRSASGAKSLGEKLRVSDDEWFVLAIDPQQKDDATSKVSVTVGSRTVPLEMRGRHTEIYHLAGDRIERVE